MTPMLLLSALASCLAAAFLAWVGWVVAVRPATSRDARTAARAFAGWWHALAVSTAATGATELLAAFGQLPLTLAVAFEFVRVASLCVGLAGLLYYLIYLYGGRTGSFWPLTIGYALGAAVVLRAIAAWGPWEVVTTDLGTTIEYLRPASDGQILLLSAFFIGPQLIAAFALFALGARLPRSAGRVRLRVVAGAIFVWFGASLVATAVGADEWAAWRLLEAWIPLLVGSCVLIVHRPPPWLERRLPPELPANAPAPPTRPRRT